MMFWFHIWLYTSMALIFWAKTYITFRKKRNPEERKLDLIINVVFAILFTFALIDLALTLPKVFELLRMLGEVVG